jgi:hypothetical protein
MKANFTKDQNLQDGGTTVAAWGPLLWDTDPAAKTVVVSELTITQNGVEATNAGSREYAKGQGTWSLPLTTPPGQRLQGGRAHGHGVVTVIDPPGGTGEPWESDIDLH